MHFEINHPLLNHKISILRDKNTGHRDFRAVVSEITMLITYEALKDIETVDITVETPLTRTIGKKIKKEIIVVPILRAGIGMLEGILSLVPDARVGFLGIYRDHDTKLPVEYYNKLPEYLVDPLAVIIDPMLATGGSAIAAIDILKKKNYTDIKIISIIAAPEGLKAVENVHPDVAIFIGSIDEFLNDNKYIIPGLGDAGDRLFGTI